MVLGHALPVLTQSDRSVRRGLLLVVQEIMKERDRLQVHELPQTLGRPWPDRALYSLAYNLTQSRTQHTIIRQAKSACRTHLPLAPVRHEQKPLPRTHHVLRHMRRDAARIILCSTGQHGVGGRGGVEDDDVLRAESEVEDRAVLLRPGVELSMRPRTSV